MQKKKYLRLLLLWVVFMSFESIGMTQSSGIKSNFKVDGQTILDPEGHEFIVKGVNVNGPHWPWKRSTVKDVDLIADIWKFNTVRINCFPRLDFIKTNLNLEEIVAAFTKKKVVSLLEVHDYGGTYPGLRDDRPPMEELIDWWVDKAERFKNNPYVWFNIMNEPGGNKPVPELWKSIHEKVIIAIRATGAENVIVLDGHHFGQEGGYKDPAWSGVLKYGPHFAENYDNIVFSIHPYSLWANAEDRYNAYVNEINLKNLPLIFGEFGDASRYDQSATSGMFKVAVPNHMGRIVWHWTSENNAGNDLTRGTTVGGGWEIDKKDGSKPTNLNWLGNIIWDDNHNQLDMASVELTGPPLYNGGFENGLSGWQNYGGGKLISGLDSTKTGKYALYFPPGKTGGGTSQLLFLQPNTTYQFMAAGKHFSLPGKQTTITIKITHQAGTENHSLSFNTTTFTSKNLVFTTPSGQQYAELSLFKMDGSVGFVVDDLTLEINNN